MIRERFQALESELALPAARPMLSATRQSFGFVPSPVAKAARSPGLLKQLLGGLTAFERSSLAPLEREVVAMTVAFENECHYCMALHSAQLAATPDSERLLGELRAGAVLSAPRLEALRQFVLALLRTRGRPSETAWTQFEAAGYSEEDALDVLLGVGAYWLSTVGNVLMGAELDAPFVPFAWSAPSPR
jgi:AhpD family alkylhydroperoxidase